VRQAIVMAAGEGRRLRPLTERIAKPVLPIDGRPVLASLLRDLAAAGIARATIVVGHLAEQVEALAGDGTAFGLEVRYAEQPLPEGSADAVRRGLATGAEAPVLITAADTLFSPGDLAVFADRAGLPGIAGALAVRAGFHPSAEKPGVLIRDGHVEQVVALAADLTLTSAPLWALGPELVPFFEGLSGPPFELKDVFQRGIDAGHRIAAIEIGQTRDLTRPVDLVVENFDYLGGIT
jgi:NDP-sugar pyrophosphorylase family protein